MAEREEKVLALLERWEEARQEGRPVGPEELCADCPELRGELERQIALHGRLERLAHSGQKHDTGPWHVEAPSTLNDSVGTPAHEGSRPVPDVPGYDGLAWVGGGGMGDVFRARDVRLHRQVALKLVRPERLTGEMLRRLEAEAQVVARLDHPHIVKVYEVGRCRPAEGSSPAPYIALELVTGGSLQQQLGDRASPPRDSARLVMLLARAVHHAHERGVVHRDLKPDNVLLGPPADEPALNTAWGVPKVTDFGLARDIEAEDRLTQTGAVMGTPAYMAPEQAEGRAAGPQSDVYALGAILYRMLAGRVPFEAPSAIDVLYQVRHQAPAPVRQVRYEVPEALEAICLRCLEKRPEDRYPSAGALAEELRRWLEEEPTEQASPRPVVNRVRPSRRRALVTAGVAGALALGGLGWWFVGGERGEGTLQGPAQGAPSPPLKGSIDVVMTRPGDRLRQLARLSDPAARPLRAGDEVRVEARLNRPAYLYVLWVDTRGEVGPVYPWVAGDWGKRREERPRRELSLPEELAGGVYKVDPGPSGMETLLLLAREEPLPASVDLRARLTGLGSQARGQAEDLHEVAWFEDGRLVTNEKMRGPNLKDVRESGHPVLRFQADLRRRLGNEFALVRAVTFGNRGGQ